MENDNTPDDKDDVPAAEGGETRKRRQGGPPSEGALRLRQVQARYEKASRLENERRAEAMKRELAMDVLKAIATGELRGPQRYAAAALGMDIPRPELGAEQQERRSQRRTQRGEQVELSMTDEQRARRAERRNRRERREAAGESDDGGGEE